MKEEGVVQNLREIKDVLDKNNVNYWLDFGTLLGAVRSGKLIEWDSDVDLGVWYGNVDQIISIFPELKSKGFRASVTEKKIEIGIRRGAFPLHLTVYRKKGGYAWGIWVAPKRKVKKLISWCQAILIPRISTKPRRSSPFVSALPLTLRRFLVNMMLSVLGKCGCIIPIVVPKHYFEKLSTIRFYGMKFNAPSENEKYLEYRYGKNWKIPMKNWRYYSDDGAINLNWDWKQLLLEA